MDVSIEQVGCLDLAEQANVRILQSIPPKISKESVLKEESIRYIILASKYASFAKNDNDDFVTFINDRSCVLTLPSLLDSYKEGTPPWSVFETSGLTIVGCGTILRKQQKRTLVKRCLRVELHKKADYGYIQLYANTNCEYDGKPYPRRSLLTFFIFRHYNAQKQMVFPPFLSLKPHSCQTYVPMQAGQGLQVITQPGINVRVSASSSGAVALVGAERRRVFDKGLVVIHRFVCKQKVEYHKDEFIIVSADGHGSAFFPLIVPGKTREWKDGLYTVVMQPHTRAIIAAANIKGFVMIQVSEEKTPWVFDADSFAVIHLGKDEVKVKFTGNPNYVMIEKVNGCWLLCESDQIVECV